MRRSTIAGFAILMLACGSDSSTCGDGVVDPRDVCWTRTPIDAQGQLITIGDLDRDGRADAVVARDDDAALVVLRADAQGRFAASGPTLPLARAAIVGDADADGEAELVVAIAEGDAGRLCGHRMDGATWSTRWCVDTPEPLYTLSIGHLGEDAATAVAGRGHDGVWIVVDPRGRADVSLIEDPIPVNGDATVHIGDVDGDRRDELWQIDREGLELRAAPSWDPSVIAMPDRVSYLSIGDIDADGRSDAIAHGVASPQGAVAFAVRLSTRGDWVQRDEIDLRWITVGDIDHDGHDDVLFVGSAPRILWGSDLADDPANAKAKSLRDGPGPRTDIILADVDGDGQLDIVSATLRDAPPGRFLSEMWLSDP